MPDATADAAGVRDADHPDGSGDYADAVAVPYRGRHPDGDTITFREKLDFRAGATIRWAVAINRETDPGVSLAEQFGLISELYVLEGVESWTLVDARGKPIEVSKPAIREHLLPFDQAQFVADYAEGLYQEVMLPLLRAASTSSEPTPTNGSTSPTTGSSPSPRKPLRRSLTSITPTAGIEATSSSLAGVSSSSQSSESAA